MFLYDVTTPAEIEETFGLPTGTVRRDLHRGKFRKSEVRKSGATWLIAWREAKRLYKKGELTMIKVRNDWDWVKAHCESEMSDTLADVAKEYMGNPFMDRNDFLNLYKLYHESIDGAGIPDGAEGEYLSFGQWLYEMKDQMDEIK